MRSSKGSRRIEVGGVEYRWRARGDDGYVVIGIWPANDVGPYLKGNLRYHETAGSQIVVTGRLVRRIIEHAITERRYAPTQPGEDLNLRVLDSVIDWADAVRAGDPPEHERKNGTIQ